LLPNPLPFETESIDTNIAMVRRVDKSYQKITVYPHLSMTSHFFGWKLKKW